MNHDLVSNLAQWKWNRHTRNSCRQEHTSGKPSDRVEVEQGVRQLSCLLFFIANVCESDTNMLHDQDEPVVC